MNQMAPYYQPMLQFNPNVAHPQQPRIVPQSAQHPPPFDPRQHQPNQPPPPPVNEIILQPGDNRAVPRTLYPNLHAAPASLPPPPLSPLPSSTDSSASSFSYQSSPHPSHHSFSHEPPPVQQHPEFQMLRDNMHSLNNK